MADPTKAERIVALIDKASNLARLICPFPEEVDEGDPIERMPDDLLEAATALGDLAQALATAREAAQREAEARLLEMREACAAICEVEANKADGPIAIMFKIAASAMRSLPLPGAERWMKLREALRSADHVLSHFACLQMGEGNLLMIKLQREKIAEALAAFEQERT